MPFCPGMIGLAKLRSGDTRKPSAADAGDRAVRTGFGWNLGFVSPAVPSLPATCRRTCGRRGPGSRARRPRRSPATGSGHRGVAAEQVAHGRCRDGRVRPERVGGDTRSANSSPIRGLPEGAQAHPVLRDGVSELTPGSLRTQVQRRKRVRMCPFVLLSSYGSAVLDSRNIPRTLMSCIRS